MSVEAFRHAMQFEPCQALIYKVCTGAGQHAHHVRLRAQGGGDEAANLLWLCAACHRHIHLNPAWSYERGYLARTAA